MAGLQPPGRGTELRDPGAHQADASDDEHFSDASEGAKSNISVPTTRVERTDDRAAHGEVPGTKAHSIRTQDATPDEYEVIPDAGDAADYSQQPSIPETVIDKVEPDQPSHGDEEGTLAHDMRKADAAPDQIRKAPEVTRTDLEGLAEADSIGREDIDDGIIPTQASGEPTSDVQDGNDGFDDDFDAFEEGADVSEDDFGAFDEGADQAASAREPQPSNKLPAPTVQSSLPILDFAALNSLDDIVSACEPYLNELFPGLASETQSPQDQLPEANQTFLTERSQSLWEQLVAPPPLQPPDWVRSRIRRLFLVSLGVPVDLDEILPASKQKKLVLPSMEAEDGERPTRSDELRPHGAVDKLKAADSLPTSRSPSTSKTERKRRGPAPPPDFDSNNARLLCSTTDTALKGFEGPTLREHVRTLDELKQRASQLLEYWLVQKDSANGDREAFEEVIENLVKHAKKVRK